MRPFGSVPSLLNHCFSWCLHLNHTTVLHWHTPVLQQHPTHGSMWTLHLVLGDRVRYIASRMLAAHPSCLLRSQEAPAYSMTSLLPMFMPHKRIARATHNLGPQCHVHADWCNHTSQPDRHGSCILTTAIYQERRAVTLGTSTTSGMSCKSHGFLHHKALLCMARICPIEL